MASVLPSDSGSLAGWGRDNVVQDLWEWFTFLDKRDRIAVVAIEDATWTRMFLKLYDFHRREEAKSDGAAASKMFPIETLKQMYNKYHQDDIKREKKVRRSSGTHSSSGSAVSGSSVNASSMSSSSSSTSSSTAPSLSIINNNMHSNSNVMVTETSDSGDPLLASSQLSDDATKVSPAPADAAEGFMDMVFRKAIAEVETNNNVNSRSNITRAIPVIQRSAKEGVSSSSNYSSVSGFADQQMAVSVIDDQNTEDNRQYLARNAGDRIIRHLRLSELSSGFPVFDIGSSPSSSEKSVGDRGEVAADQRGISLTTITLSEALVQDMDQFLNLFRLATKQTFLSRALPADDARSAAFSVAIGQNVGNVPTGNGSLPNSNAGAGAGNIGSGNADGSGTPHPLGILPWLDSLRDATNLTMSSHSSGGSGGISSNSNSNSSSSSSSSSSVNPQVNLYCLLASRIEYCLWAAYWKHCAIDFVSSESVAPGNPLDARSNRPVYPFSHISAQHPYEHLSKSSLIASLANEASSRERNLNSPASGGISSEDTVCVSGVSTARGRGDSLGNRNVLQLFQSVDDLNQFWDTVPDKGRESLLKGLRPVLADKSSGPHKSGANVNDLSDSIIMQLFFSPISWVYKMEEARQREHFQVKKRIHKAYADYVAAQLEAAEDREKQQQVLSNRRRLNSLDSGGTGGNSGAGGGAGGGRKQGKKKTRKLVNSRSGSPLLSGSNATRDADGINGDKEINGDMLPNPSSPISPESSDRAHEFDGAFGHSIMGSAGKNNPASASKQSSSLKVASSNSMMDTSKLRHLNQNEATAEEENMTQKSSGMQDNEMQKSPASDVSSSSDSSSSSIIDDGQWEPVLPRRNRNKPNAQKQRVQNADTAKALKAGGALAAIRDEDAEGSSSRRPSNSSSTGGSESSIAPGDGVENEGVESQTTDEKVKKTKKNRADARARIRIRKWILDDGGLLDAICTRVVYESIQREGQSQNRKKAENDSHNNKSSDPQTDVREQPWATVGGSRSSSSGSSNDTAWSRVAGASWSSNMSSSFPSSSSSSSLDRRRTVGNNESSDTGEWKRADKRTAGGIHRSNSSASLSGSTDSPGLPTSSSSSGIYQAPRSSSPPPSSSSSYWRRGERVVGTSENKGPSRQSISQGRSVGNGGASGGGRIERRDYSRGEDASSPSSLNTRGGVTSTASDTGTVSTVQKTVSAWNGAAVIKAAHRHTSSQAPTVAAASSSSSATPSASKATVGLSQGAADASPSKQGADSSESGQGESVDNVERDESTSFPSLSDIEKSGSMNSMVSSTARDKLVSTTSDASEALVPTNSSKASSRVQTNPATVVGGSSMPSAPKTWASLLKGPASTETIKSTQPAVKSRSAGESNSATPEPASIGSSNDTETSEQTAKASYKETSGSATISAAAKLPIPSKMNNPVTSTTVGSPSKNLGQDDTAVSHPSRSVASPHSRTSAASRPTKPVSTMSPDAAPFEVRHNVHSVITDVISDVVMSREPQKGESKSSSVSRTPTGGKSTNVSMDSTRPKPKAVEEMGNEKQRRTEEFYRLQVEHQLAMGGSAATVANLGGGSRSGGTHSIVPNTHQIHQHPHHQSKGQVPHAPTTSGSSGKKGGNGNGGSVGTHRQPMRGISDSGSVPPGNNFRASSSTSRADWGQQQLLNEQLLQEQEHKQKMNQLHMCLSENIDDFHCRLARTMGPRRRQRQVVEHAIQDIVADIWPGDGAEINLEESAWQGRGKVVLYGSGLTGLDIPSSDVDIVVCGVGSARQPLPVSADLAARIRVALFPYQTQSPLATTVGTAVHATTQGRQLSEAFSKLKGTGHKPPEHSTGKEKHKAEDEAAAATMEGILTELEQRDPSVSNLPDPQHQQPYQQHFVPSIQRLAYELSQCDWVINIKTIETASIPVIKLLVDPRRCSSAAVFSEDWQGRTHVDGLMPVDISFLGEEHAGIESSDYVRHLTEHRYPEAVSLTLVIKEMLSQLELNEAYTGGLSSYAVLLMVVAVLQICRNDAASEAQQFGVTNMPAFRGTKSGAKGSIKDEKSAFATWKAMSDRGGVSMGALLTRFLSFFGREFDIRQHGLNTKRVPPVYDLRPEQRPLQHFSACPVIDDPISTEGRNVTRSAFRFEQDIQWLFSNKLTELEIKGCAMLEEKHRKQQQQLSGKNTKGKSAKNKDIDKVPNILKEVILKY